MSISILDFLAVPHLFPSVSTPSIIPPFGMDPFDWTGCSIGIPTAPARRANAQVAFDTREAFQVVIRQMQRERELVRTRRLLRLQQIVTRSNLQRAAVEYENKLKAASAAYAVLLAEL